MPPVFAPWLLSPTRLKSWAGTRGTTFVPSHRTISEHSSPSSPSSIITVVPASPNASPLSFSSMSRHASSKSFVTSTPFPAASPSVLITYGADIVFKNAIASVVLLNVPYCAVGTEAAFKKSFINAFDPSSSAPSSPGPMTVFP